MWWRQAVTHIPQTLEECNRQMRSNYRGATLMRNGVVLVKKGRVIDVIGWRKRVKRVFDRSGVVG